MANRKPSFARRIGDYWTGLKMAMGLWLRKLIRICLIIAVLVVAVPVGLTVLYSSPSVNPVSTLMLGRMLTGKSVDRRWVAFEQINPVLVHSVMMSEDAKICTHSGVDWSALNQVIDDAIDGEKTRGASTLSMQTAKNLFLWPSRSYFRKALELPLALLADAVWTKKRTVEIYLNIAEWGEGVFGIEAAAQTYFKRSSKRLSARQSALLAVTLPNPKNRNPAKPSRTLSRMAKKIQNRAYRSGAYIKCIK